FALARPKAFSERLNLSTERSVAAVLLFDTSPRMDYVIEDKAGRRTRLDDAKQRAKEFIKELPTDSKVAVLETAQAAKNWLTPAKARFKIDELKTRPDNYSVTFRLRDAYELLEKLALDTDETNRTLPRFLYVFSDRTQGCWEPNLIKRCQNEADR